jgi:hypothetical protein
MQPFSIQCVTCKSKLTVSKPALLGQILVCPKCNSMVQIPESHPSETEILAPASDSPEVSIAQQHDDHTDTVEDFGYTANQISAGSTNSPNHQDASNHTSPGSDKASPSVVDSNDSFNQGTLSDWADTSATGKHKKLLAIFSCISALILIGVIITFSLTGEKTSETAINNQDNSQVQNNQPEQKGPAEEDVSTQAKEPNEAKTTSDETSNEDTVDSETEEQDSEMPTNPKTPSKLEENTIQVSDEPENPLPVAPEGLIPETPNNPGNDDMPEDLNSVIDDLAPFLNNAPIDVADAAPVAKLPMTNNDTPRAPATPVNIEGGLSFTVPEMDIANPIPLNQFLDFLGTLGNIPFTFDFESLELANLSHTAGVKHNSSNQTIEKILMAVLNPLQMAHQIEDGHVLISAKSHTDPTINTIVYKQDLVDTLKDEETAATLSDIINTLLTTADSQIAKPIADDETGEIFHLEISGNNRTQDKVRQLLARIADPVTGTGSYESRSWTQYQKTLTMDFSNGAPLLQVLIYLNSNSELQLQANWKNIWQSGWTPKSQVKIATADASLQDCLEKTLGKTGLSYIARANGVLEITTAEHALAANQIGLYDISKMPVTKRDALVNTLNQLTKEEENDISIRLIEALPDGRLGLSAPAAIHRLVAKQLKEK